jgi:hypothetical protein
MSKATPELVVGGLYAIPGPDGYQMIRLILVGEEMFVFRIYTNAFPEVPASVRPEELAPVSPDEHDRTMPYLMVDSPEGLSRDGLVLVQQVPVTEAELLDFQNWLTAALGLIAGDQEGWSTR